MLKDRLFCPLLSLKRATVEVVRGTKSSDTVLLVLGDECWFWNSRVSYQTKSNIQLGVGLITGNRIN